MGLISRGLAGAGAALENVGMEAFRNALEQEKQARILELQHQYQTRRDTQQNEFTTKRDATLSEQGIAAHKANRATDVDAAVDQAGRMTPIEVDRTERVGAAKNKVDAQAPLTYNGVRLDPVTGQRVIADEVARDADIKHKGAQTESTMAHARAQDALPGRYDRSERRQERMAETAALRATLSSADAELRTVNSAIKNAQAAFQKEVAESGGKPDPKRAVEHKIELDELQQRAAAAQSMREQASRQLLRFNDGGGEYGGAGGRDVMAPTQAAIDFLNANPDTAEKFENKFGVPASRYLNPKSKSSQNTADTEPKTRAGLINSAANNAPADATEESAGRDLDAARDKVREISAKFSSIGIKRSKLDARNRLREELAQAEKDAAAALNTWQSVVGRR